MKTWGKGSTALWGTSPSAVLLAVLPWLSHLGYSTGPIPGPACFSRPGWFCAFKCGYLPLPHVAQQSGQGPVLLQGRDAALPHGDSCAGQMGRWYAWLEVLGSYIYSERDHLTAKGPCFARRALVSLGPWVTTHLFILHHLGNLWGPYKPNPRPQSWAP